MDSHSVLEDICQVFVGSANHQVTNAFNVTAIWWGFHCQKIYTYLDREGD